MLFVIRQANSQKFCLAQMNQHTYVDARSAEIIFNKIIRNYNALTQNNYDISEKIIGEISVMTTLSANSIIKENMQNTEYDLGKNKQELLEYSCIDNGNHGIPIESLSVKLPLFLNTKRELTVKYFNIDKYINTCRKEYPEVSKNSIVSAIIAKAFDNLNIFDGKIPNDRRVSFKMVADILSVEQRHLYLGNYIAFMPCTVNGELSIAEIAKEINDRVIEFKKKRIDTAMFALVEDLAEQEAVGTFDDTVSFIMTNWTNHTFIQNENFLEGCTRIRHQSGVNVAPKNYPGAALVNRPVLATNFSPKGELCVSMFPSLDSDKVNHAVMNSFSNIADEI
jgi:hypothetical protein